MEIIPILPRGYCKGVVAAINIAKKCSLEYPDKDIYVLGMIVHNQYIVDALNSLNIKTIESKDKTRLELLDEINDGVVIFTAHGISDTVKQKAQEKGLICIDASCTDVITTQDIVKKHINEGFTVLYIGQKNHPEAEAIISISNKVILITPNSVIPTDIKGKVFVTNQTTMSIVEIKDIIDNVKTIYPNAIIQEEICNATRIRQEALMKHKDLDVVFIVGDTHSNNSNKLKDIAINSGTKNVYLIQSNLDITEDMIKDKNKIGVTSGASTPTYLTEQVISVLKEYANTNKLIHLPISIHNIL